MPQTFLTLARLSSNVDVGLYTAYTGFRMSMEVSEKGAFDTEM